jgi:hypothetical protein
MRTSGPQDSMHLRIVLAVLAGLQKLLQTPTLTQAASATCVDCF